MKRFIFALVLLLATVWSYFYYVRSENLIDQITGKVDPTKGQQDYQFVRKSGTPAHWETAAPMIGMRVNATAAAIGDKAYVIGGNDEFGRTVATVEAYDVKTNSWSRVADLPKALHHGTAATDGKLIYVFGGMKGIAQTPVDTLYIFDPAKGAWTEGTTMGRTIGASAVAYDGRLFHIFGGLGLGESSQQHQVYDPMAQTFSLAEPMVSGRDHFTAETVGDRVCVFGGRAGSLVYNLNLTECQKLSGGPWDQLASIPAKRSSLGSAIIDGKVFVFGGEGSSATFGDMYAWDPVADKWTISESMPTARHGFAWAQINARIYVFGGGRRAGYSVSNVTEVYTPAIPAIAAPAAPAKK